MTKEKMPSLCVAAFLVIALFLGPSHHWKHVQILCRSNVSADQPHNFKQVVAFRSRIRHSFYEVLEVMLMASDDSFCSNSTH